jgi:hypothetical protein
MTYFYHVCIADDHFGLILPIFSVSASGNYLDDRMIILGTNNFLFLPIIS